MTNYEKFESELIKQYTELLKTMEYAQANIKYDAKNLGQMITCALKHKRGDKNGTGVRAVCKILGIKNTYKAIEEYLN